MSTTDQTTTQSRPPLTSEQRQALRKLIGAHANWSALRQLLGKDLSTLTIQELWSATDQLKIDPAPIFMVAAPAVPAAPAAPVKAAKPAAPAKVATASLSVEKAVKAVMDGSMQGFETRVRQLAEQLDTATKETARAKAQAAHASTTPTKPGQTPAIIATVIDPAADLATVFGVRSQKLNGLTVQLWDSPNAPAIDPDYAWCADTLKALAAAESTGLKPWLYGPKGTGKSSMAEQYAARTGRDFVRICFDADTSSFDLYGSTGLVDGSTVYEPGLLVTAARTAGAIVLLDEPTATKASVQFSLHGPLDNTGVSLKDGSMLFNADGVQFWSADNTNGTGDASGNYAGTNVMNSALIDRFGLTIAVGYQSKDKEAKFVSSRSGLNRAACDTLIDFAHVTRAQARDGLLTEGLGPRRLIALAKLLACNIDPREALALAITNRMRSDESETIMQLVNAHLNTETLTREIQGLAPAASNPAAPEFSPVV